jgi:ligand-binding SRPBCC domain-containing protein
VPTFHYTFYVSAPQQAVLAFHQDGRVLKRLMPPPLFVQFHERDGWGEGATTDFTLWFGPVPVRWQAVHYNLSETGFSDRQTRGPLRAWQHAHRFEAIDSQRTRIREQVLYEHHDGLRGLLTRLLFNQPGLTALFTYRQLITRLSLVPTFRRRLGLLATTPVIAYALWRAVRGQRHAR